MYTKKLEEQILRLNSLRRCDLLLTFFMTVHSFVSRFDRDRIEKIAMSRIDHAIDEFEHFQLAEMDAQVHHKKIRSTRLRSRKF